MRGPMQPEISRADTKAPEVHSYKWQILTNNGFPSANAARWGTGHRDSQTTQRHRFCFFSFSLSGAERETRCERVKAEFRQRKGNSCRFREGKKEKKTLCLPVCFHKEGGRRGARCFHMHWNGHMSNGLLYTSDCLRMERFSLPPPLFSTRYWGHCVPDTLTYLAELNRLKLTGHPASLEINHTASTSVSPHKYQPSVLFRRRYELHAQTSPESSRLG